MSQIRFAAIVIIGPLIPIALLYWLFGAANFFDLQGNAQYVLKAGGPIAAYLILIVVVAKLMLRHCKSENADRIVGEWTFEARSNSGKTANGSCRIEGDNGELQVGGLYEENARPRTAWTSEFAVVNSSRLVFRANVTTPDGVYQSIVYLHLTDNDGKRFRTMSGNWESFQGAARKSGGITFKRRA